MHCAFQCIFFRDRRQSPQGLSAPPWEGAAYVSSIHPEWQARANQWDSLFGGLWGLDICRGLLWAGTLPYCPLGSSPGDSVHTQASWSSGRWCFDWRAPCLTKTCLVNVHRTWQGATGRVATTPSPPSPQSCSVTFLTLSGFRHQFKISLIFSSFVTHKAPRITFSEPLCHGLANLIAEYLPHAQVFHEHVLLWSTPSTPPGIVFSASVHVFPLPALRTLFEL